MDALRGPVGIPDAPSGVDGPGEGPPLVGVCEDQPPRPPREEKPPLEGGIYLGPDGGIVGLAVSERCTGPGVRDGEGWAPGVPKGRLDDGPVGALRRAAGPRGGDLLPARPSRSEVDADPSPYLGD